MVRRTRPFSTTCLITSPTISGGSDVNSIFVRFTPAYVSLLERVNFLLTVYCCSRLFESIKRMRIRKVLVSSKLCVVALAVNVDNRNYRNCNR